VLLIALTLGALGSVWDYGYVEFDDPDYASRTTEVTCGLTGLANIRWAFTTWHAGNWHPLTWLSLQLDCTFSDPVPSTFHRTNLLLHLANVLILAEVLRRMTGCLWPSAVVAGLFAVHPLHVESVAWISERKDVLSTFFGFLALAAYVRYVRQPSWWAMGLVMLAQAASLMSKPMLVTLPCLLLLLDWWPLARFARISDFRWLVVEKIPLFLISAASCVMTCLSQIQGNPNEVLGRTPLAVRLANAIDSVVCYMRQMFYPVNLAIFYPFPYGGLPWATVLAEALLLVAITVGVCWLARSRPYLAVGWSWYLGTLVPVLGLVQVGDQARADRYTYIPLIGLFIMLTWGIRDLFPRHQRALAVLAGGVILACFFVTRAQVRHWETDLALWEHTVAVTKDNALARINYAVALFRKGRLDASLLQAQEALRIKPQSPTINSILAQIHEERHEWDEAEDCYRRAIELRPENRAYPVELQLLREKRKKTEKPAKGVLPKEVMPAKP
jgi:tetratricopeptide (TPR) repeat protein